MSTDDTASTPSSVDLRRVQFASKDEPLRSDVSMLGSLVGEVLREQGGDEFFELVERSRQAAIAARESDESEGGESSVDAIYEAVEGLSAEVAEDLARAFSTYFEVVNLAERVHRIRRRRDYLRRGDLQPGSFAAVLGRLQEAGFSADEVRGAVEGLWIEPVFTAHPTEATRRVLLEKEQAVARLLTDRLDPSLTPPELQAIDRSIRAHVTSGWQTTEHPQARPSVADEREQVLFYVLDVLYRIAPPFYEELNTALADTYVDKRPAEGAVDPAGADFPREPILRFSSWVGSDMDGNPNVSAATIEESLRRQRSLVLQRYGRELDRLKMHLTQSRERVGVDEVVEQRLEEYGRLFARNREAQHPRHREMPYRLLLELMKVRLEVTANDETRGYYGPEELEHDLLLIAGSLLAHGGAGAGHFAVMRLVRRVRTFGFHLVGMDVRQDAQVHREVLAQLLGDDDWSNRPSAERTERLLEALHTEQPPQAPDHASRQALAVFSTLERCLRRYGEGAIGPYIISMAEDVDDVLSVLVLARWAGLLRKAGGVQSVPLDVAPLFETVADLERAPRVLEALLQTSAYREHLSARQERQVVMLGYSDSCKDGGVVASRWALVRAQDSLSRVAHDGDLELMLFHGRGGTIGRGGSKTEAAVAAAPIGSVAGALRVTEQGEVIDEKYGLRGIALRTLERAAGAVLAKTLEDERELRRRGDGDGGSSGESDTVLRESRAEWLDQLAQAAEKSYRDLVQREDFIDYFRSATPIDVIERLNIGSRPASRRSGSGIENLRAIPWVFSWTQSRHGLPGWYGLGSALEHMIEQAGIEESRRLLQGWYFLDNLLGDAEMAMGKSDLRIARRYAQLSSDPAVFEQIEAEWHRTTETIQSMLGTQRRLEREPMLERAIRLRNPYIDPMSCLQIDLLVRWRASEREDEECFRALLATINGIARGLMSTG